MDDSAVVCDEFLQSYNEEKKFNKKKATCKMKDFYILPVFLLIIITLLIAVSIHCYLIKYREKQKHLLTIHDTKYQLREVLY